jgi:hypothetical protein
MASKGDEPARPVLGPSDAVLSTPLRTPPDSPGQPRPGRPVISGAADAVIGAPLTPPPEEARQAGLQLGVDAAGGFTVPRELDGKKRRPHRRP